MWHCRQRSRLGLRQLSHVVAMLALVLLAACSTSHQPVLLTPPVPSPTPTAQSAGPQPVSGLLDPAPTSCPATPPLPTKTFAHFGAFPSPVTLQGGPVVWVPGGYFPGTLHLDADDYTAYPGTKIIWELGPNYTQAATVQVTNLATGRLAWWGAGDPPAPNATTAQTLGLNASGPSPADAHGAPPAPGWLEYGSFVYFSQAGCYVMEVTWPGGHWRDIFAVGR